MRQEIIAVLVSLTVVVTAFARPEFIGHRGSYWGVENSAEAFIAGAEAGYKYLETDVKVAGDGTFILIHDDDTKRLGGNLNITEATIEELKAETYTQTRGGVEYTGKICTLEEYLQICKDYDCIPFIELKWADGINNNDCSNLGRMVETVIEYGFGDEAIINTSMRDCLKYIRDNFPDFKLMFLCNTNWETYFDWCVENGMGAYIQTGCFDKETVIKFHEQGLPVGVWTVNTAENYKIYGNYGCDFIAVDYLSTENLPELDPYAPLVPNKVDYPDNRGIVQDEYEPVFTQAVALKNVDVKKAMFHEDTCYMLEENGSLLMIDKTNKCKAVLPGQQNISDIALSADGMLHLSVQDGAGSVKLMALSDGDLIEKATLENALPDAAIAISGRSGDDMYVYYEGLADGNEVIYRLEISRDDVNSSFNKISGLDVESMIVSPFSRDNILIKDAGDGSFGDYSFNDEENGVELMRFAAAPMAAFPSVQDLILPFRYGASLYAISARRDDGGKAVYALIDITGGLQSAYAASSDIVPFETGGNGYLAGYGRVESGCIYLTFFDGSAGVATYMIEGEEPEGNIGEVDFRIEKLWSYTDNEGNAPEHIDGTNAQQGGAYNGFFYINDCSDRLIYVYGESGFAGTLPGGGGWSATCDDAGNIIVRDDKETGKSHSLLVYPSGTQPNSGVEATRIDFELLDEGQTNFISASGDVLGEGGHVYFFPNGQTVVNIINMENGNVAGVERSGELSVVSTTAGYVIPYKDNPKNWLYMVRNDGIYEYNGTDAGLLVGGSSIRPPLRNSTCGAEYFMLSSHKIIVYNSGANYKGGFTIKDLTANEYVETISPIGSKGYEEGGNYSVSNWIFAEKIDASSYYLYQYCPANGIAVYKFWDANYEPEEGDGVEEVAMTSYPVVYPNPVVDVLYFDKFNFDGTVSVYSISGNEVLRTDGTDGQIDVSKLPAGIYLFKAGENVSRFIKR